MKISLFAFYFTRKSYKCMNSIMKKVLMDLLSDHEIHFLNDKEEGYLSGDNTEIIHWPKGDHNLTSVDKTEDFLNNN